MDTPLVDQQFSYVRLAAPMLDTAVISIEFCGAIITRFCFAYLLGGVTAMPRGLHARLCHEFLVALYRGTEPAMPQNDFCSFRCGFLQTVL